MATHLSALITGASSGIGAVYADRLARRGHDLVLVARDRSRMDVLAGRLRKDTGVSVDILQADLTASDDLLTVESRLRDDGRIGILVNNAGMSVHGEFVDQRADELTQIISLNVTALSRLAIAVTPRFVSAGKGAIVNISSVVSLAPEFGLTVYGATKAFVLFLSQGMQRELGPKGVYVQAVLPAATRTEIWERSGFDLHRLSAVMETDALVDAALVGFDRREAVTIPSLPDDSQWNDLEAVRQAMLPHLNRAQPAHRYLSVE